MSGRMLRKLALPIILMIAALIIGRMVADLSGPDEGPTPGALHTDQPRIRAAVTAEDEQLRRDITVAGLSFDEAAAKSVTLGFNHFFDSDYRAAMQRFNEALILDRDNGDAYHGFALVLYARDSDLAGAEAMFREAVSRDTASPGAAADYGRFLIAAARYDDAIEVLDEALDRWPNHAPTAARLAIAQFSAGNASDACRLARFVLDEAPDAERPVLEAILENDVCG